MSASIAETVLVTGATGAVGPGVVRALCAAGWRVRTLSLDQAPKGELPDDIESRIGDVTDPAAVQFASRELFRLDCRSEFSAYSAGNVPIML